MDLTRRGFMNLLGVLGVTSAAAPVVSLFGSDEAQGIIVPEAQAVSGHYVVKPKRFLEKIPEADRKAVGYGGKIVGRVVRNREPVKPHSMRDHYFKVDPLQFDGMTVSDCHSSFYVASHQLREQFTTATRNLLAEVEPELRAMASIISIVDSPIHVRPHPTEERGFVVAAAVRQFVVIGVQKSEIETYEIYSDRGEFPISIPNDIEMGMLLKLDREIVSNRVFAPSNRIAQILASRRIG